MTADNRAPGQATEAEVQEPTELDLLVRETAVEYRSLIGSGEDGFFVIGEAARNVIDRKIEEGRDPGDLALDLSRITKISPALLDLEFAIEGRTWAEIYSGVAKSIVREEVKARYPHLQEKERLILNSH